LVLASHEYNELDYIRDYNKFLEYKWFIIMVKLLVQKIQSS
jgi:hypothetical protein